MRDVVTEQDSNQTQTHTYHYVCYKVLKKKDSRKTAQ